MRGALGLPNLYAKMGARTQLSRPLAGALAGCAALATGSLLLDLTPGFDAWGWLVWGREVGELSLDTGGGPSWKPLPVMLTAPLTLAGEAAPELWLLIIRFAWLLSALLAGLLAARLSAGSGRVAFAAGALAAVAVIAIDDSFTPWLRQGLTGLSEPLLAAATLGAALAWVEGRRRTALGLLIAASLLRPEAWLLALLVATQAPRTSRWLLTMAAGAVAIAAVWFLPDLAGSGSPLTGAERAREGSGFPPVEALEVLLRLALMPLAVLWPGVALALRSSGPAASAAAGAHPVGGEVLLARRRQLAAAAGIWTAQVAVLAALGYAGLPRFLLPAALVVCALGAVGLLELPRKRGPSVRPALLAAVALLAAGQLVWRGADLVGDARGTGERAAREAEILSLAAPLSRDARADDCAVFLLGDYLHATALAWQLERPLEAVRPLPQRTAPPRTSAAILEAGDPEDERIAGFGRAVADADGWKLVDLGCLVALGFPNS